MLIDIGFLIGLILQACSLYAIYVDDSIGEADDAGASAGGDTGTVAHNLDVPVVFVLYFFLYSSTYIQNCMYTTLFIKK